MQQKIILAGGTGFIGSFLKSRFEKMDYEVIVISRRKGAVSWKDPKGMLSVLEGSAMLINLAGKSVDCRYTPRNKEEILSSRITTTQALGELVLQCNNPPPLWINASSATIYRNAEDHPMTEDAGEIGEGFSVDVARRWEAAFFHFDLTNTRQVALRISIALGKGGGVVKPFINLVRFGLGGRQGNGRQRFSWIHLEDILGIICFVQAHAELRGVYNCTSPGPVTNTELMRTFRQYLHPVIALPAPKWVLEIGARIIHTETELLLKSRWVIPEKLLQAGYVFRYPALPAALKNILCDKTKF